MFMFALLVHLYSLAVVPSLYGLWRLVKYIKYSPSSPKLPPGPPGHWLFGNKIATSRVPFVFAKLTDEYGPVFSLRRGSQLMIVIGRYHAAMEIMEKQGASLADRPRMIAAGETLSGGLRVLVQHAGERLRTIRRVLHVMLKPTAAATYEPVQVQHAKNVLLDMLQNPKQHQMHVKRYAASVIMSITYGKITPTAYTDPEVLALNRCLIRFGQTMRPGAYLVDTYPILGYIPGYLSKLRNWHREEFALFQGQLDIVREQMQKGSARSCFATFLLENQSRYGFTDKEMVYVAGSMFGAGSDTTAAAISINMLAAALHPEAQARIQEELDSVVGRDRLPSFDDQCMLPYMNAFILECARWRPVTIGGIARRATTDIMWNNYWIPKGATVIANHWAIANDPDVFPNPDTFDPLRWLTAEGKVRDDVRYCTYGFGRRICPGLQVANRSVFINTAMILWAFALSEDPAAPIDAMAFTDGVNQHPMPFDLVFKARVSEAVIKQLCMSDDGEESG